MNWIVRYWWVLASFLYGFVAAALGSPISEPMYWHGLVFGIVSYVGARLQELHE